MGLWRTNGSPNLCQTTRPYSHQQKNENKIKLKENEMKNKFLGLTKELKNFRTWKWQLYQSWLMLLVKSPKEVEVLEIRGRMEIIQTITLLRTDRILRRVLETFCHSNPHERRSANAGGKNCQRVNYKLKYWEESWRLEETCCHSNFNERPSANAGVKNSQVVNYK